MARTVGRGIAGLIFSTLLALLSRPVSGYARADPPQESGAAPDLLTSALDHRYNLEYDLARLQLEAWLTQHPADPRALNYLATVILYGEMFQRGILETHFYGELGDMFRTGKISYSAAFQQELFRVLEKAQSLSENRLKQNPDDQEAMYWAGSAHATRAVFYFTMAKSYLAALRESIEARGYHARLLKANPNFVDALLVIGLNDYVAGSLPWYIKLLASLAGYRGNRAQGIEEVKRVAEQGHLARQDAKFILAILYRREKMYVDSLKAVEELAQSYPRNFLLQREIARIEQILGDWGAARNVYDAMVAKYNAREPGYIVIPAAKLLYEAGQIHEHLGELAEALGSYESAGRLPGGDIYVYRAELAAADLYLRLNRRGEAFRKYERVSSAVPATDEGKAARRALKKLQVGGPARAGGAR